MRLRSCLWREMAHRPLGWLLTLLAVAAVGGHAAGAWRLLQSHDGETAALLEQFKTRTEQRLRDLNNEVRLFAKSLGYNLLLLPPGQDPTRFWLEDQSQIHLDPALVARMAGLRLQTLNHLLPMLRHRLDWPTFGAPVILVGYDKQVYIKHPDWQDPIWEPLAAGQVQVGHRIHSRLNLDPGSTIDLAGRKLTVTACLPSEASSADLTLYLPLDDLRAILGTPKALSGLLALTCQGGTADAAAVTAELAGHGIDLQVFESTTKAWARERARVEVKRSGEAGREDLLATRKALRERLMTLIRLLMAVVLLAAILAVAVLTLINVRERAGEIAVLRTLGFSRVQVLALILAKAGLIGLLAGLIGVPLGWLAVTAATTGEAVAMLLPALAIIVGCAFLALFAALPPALRAAATDPAHILNREGV